MEIIAKFDATGEQRGAAETSVVMDDYAIDRTRPNGVEIAMRFMHSNPGPTKAQRERDLS